MKKVLSILCMSFVLSSAMAQNSYIVKTKGAKKTEVAKTDNGNAETEEADEPQDFIGKNFKFHRLCDWQEGMKFMVMPEKYDLVMGTFCDENGKDVSGGSLKYKIMVYKGHSIRKDGTSIINFECQDNNKKYYYPIPYGSFDDYCYNKNGVPTLAYLGDVDIAREKLMGATLYTKTTVYRVDTETDGEGFLEKTVQKELPVKVVAVGVGSRSFPVKIIVEDENGNQFFQNVAMSKTNSGFRDDELALNKYLFYNNFSIADPTASASESYVGYIGRQVYTKYKTTMTDLMGQNVIMPRLSQFTIKKIEAQSNTNYVKMTLQSASDGYQYVKNVTFKNDKVIGDIDGYKEDYYGYLFREGNVGKDIPVKHMSLIRNGKVARGFTMEEVKLAKGTPKTQTKNRNGISVWTYENGSIVRFNKSGRVL